MKIRPLRFLIGAVSVFWVMVFRFMEITLSEHRRAAIHDAAPYLIVIIVFITLYAVLEEV